MSKRNKKEAVNHPSHYGGEGNPLEVINIIEFYELGFCLGNTVKYICRRQKKAKSKELEDLKKAQWYLNRQIQTLEKKNAQRKNHRR